MMGRGEQEGQDGEGPRGTERPGDRYAAILEMVSFAAELFLRKPDWEAQVPRVLAGLGQAASASRSYIFTVRQEGGRHLGRPLSEWVAPGVSTQIDNPDLADVDLEENGFGRWCEVLARGGVIHGRVDSLPADERAILEAQDILALIVAPIFVDARWWGFIGFDDCRTPRAWSKAETEALRAAANLLGAAVERRRTEQAIRDSEERYQRLFAGAQRQAKELELLERVRGSLAHGGPNPGFRTGSKTGSKTVFETVVEGVHDAFGYDMVSLYLIEGERLKLQHQFGYPQPLTDIPLDRGVMAQVALSGQPRLIENLSLEPGALLAAADVLSEVAVPLRDGPRVVGVLNVETRRGATLGRADLRLLTAVGEQLSLVFEREALHRQVSESERRYRSVVESVREVIFQIDDEGRWTFLNTAWTDITGFAVAASLGEFFLDFVHEDDRALGLALFTPVIRGRQASLRHELRYLTREGEARWAELYVQAQGEPGRPQGASGTITDITERVTSRLELESQKRFYEDILAALPASVAVFDAEGRYRFCNPAAVADSETREWLVGRTDLDYGARGGLDRALAERRRERFMEAAASRHAVSWEERVEAADGSLKHYLRHLLPVFSAAGELELVLGYGLDISKRKQAERIQAAVYAISEAAHTAPNLRALFASIHGILGGLMPAGNIFVALYDAASDTVSFPYHVDEHDPPPAPRRAGGGLTEYVLRTGAALLASPSDLARLTARGEAEAIGALPVAWLGAPLRSRDTVFGAVVLQSYDDDVRYTEADKHVLVFVAEQIAMTLERHRADEALRRSEVNLTAIFEHSQDAFMLLGRDYRVQAFNRVADERVRRVFGKKLTQGMSALELVQPEHLESFKSLLERAFSGLPTRTESEIAAAGGSYWAEIAYNPVWDEERRVAGVVFSSRDVTERKRYEAQIEHMAYFDSLTGLPNRRHLQERAKEALARGREVALLYLDLDRFKTINDTLGHEAGDALLMEIATGLTSCLRKSDTLARLGGDEFAFLLADTDPFQAVQIAERILAVLARPFELSGQSLHLGGSVGIACSDASSTLGPSGDPPSILEDLLKHADIAMYQAKAGGGGYAFYDPHKSPYKLERLGLEAELRRAVAAKALTLHYQPMLDLRAAADKVGNTGGKTGGDTVRACEALVRWPRGDGLLAAGAFVPLAEESKLIRLLDRLVLEAALAQAAAWFAAGRDLRLSLNLSARSLHDRSLAPFIGERLRAGGLPPERILLEITESAAMHKPEESLETLHALRRLGLKLAIDDFGSGFASLTYLRQLPVDQVKIDKNLVQGLGENGKDEQLVKAAIALGHGLGLEVVAEGVETAAQLSWLREEGCDLAQGYFIGRPGPADAL